MSPVTASRGELAPSDFVLINAHLQESAPLDEWMAQLAGNVEVTISGDSYSPSPSELRKAREALLDLDGLEHRARRLLPQLAHGSSWQLLAVDFGAAARTHRCEFLMCFAPAASVAGARPEGGYVEIGFDRGTDAHPASYLVPHICHVWN